MLSSTAQSTLPPLICQNDAGLLAMSARYSYTLEQGTIACKMRKFISLPVKSMSLISYAQSDLLTSQLSGLTFKDE